MSEGSRYADLTHLADQALPVYCSPGSEARARLTSARCERAQRFLSTVLDQAAQIRVLVLAPEHWAAFATYPGYGMPHYPDAQTLLIASQDNDVWQSMAPPVEVLPPPHAHMYQAVYGRRGDSVDLSAFFDLLAVHEMGHLFLEQAGKGFPRLWLMEFFCNLALHTYVAVEEPDQLLALETFPQAIVSLGACHLAHRSLADFERLYVGVGPQNYGWYQSHLLGAAKRLYDAGGIEPLQRLWRDTTSLHGEIGDEELTRRLRDDVHPELGRILSEWPK